METVIEKGVAWSELLDAIFAALETGNPSISKTEKTDAIRIITACCMAIAPDQNNVVGTGALMKGTAGYSGELMCLIADAIMDADIQERHRDLIYGSFRMAEAFLFAMHDRPD